MTVLIGSILGIWAIVVIVSWALARASYLREQAEFKRQEELERFVSGFDAWPPPVPEKDWREEYRRELEKVRRV